MKRKIKLTEKDLRIEVRSSGDPNGYKSQQPDTETETQEIKCQWNSLELGCPTATFRTVCLSKDPTCDCVDPETQRVGCYDTGNNCIDPETRGSQCNVCETYNCNQTNTCNCDYSLGCGGSAGCAEPLTIESVCVACVSNDCVVSNECPETEVCMASFDCDTNEECYTMLATECGVIQPKD